MENVIGGDDVHVLMAIKAMIVQSEFVQRVHNIQIYHMQLIKLINRQLAVGKGLVIILQGYVSVKRDILVETVDIWIALMVATDVAVA